LQEFFINPPVLPATTMTPTRDLTPFGQNLLDEITTLRKFGGSPEELVDHLATLLRERKAELAILEHRQDAELLEACFQLNAERERFGKACIRLSEVHARAKPVYGEEVLNDVREKMKMQRAQSSVKHCKASFS
jgi:hypothetical protein